MQTGRARARRSPAGASTYHRAACTLLPRKMRQEPGQCSRRHSLNAQRWSNDLFPFGDRLAEAIRSLSRPCRRAASGADVPECLARHASFASKGMHTMPGKTTSITTTCVVGDEADYLFEIRSQPAARGRTRSTAVASANLHDTRRSALILQRWPRERRGKMASRRRSTAPSHRHGLRPRFSK